MRILLPCALLLTTAAAAFSADGYTAEAGGGRPMLGIEMSPVPQHVQTTENLTPDQGVLVRQVFPNTAASRMGLQPGDVVLQVNGSPIASMTDLRNEVGMNNVGDPVDVIVRRGGQDVVASTDLREWPSAIPFERIDADAERRFREWQQRRLQRSVQEVDDLDRQVRDLKEAMAGTVRQDNRSWTVSPVVREALGMLAMMPAWTLSYEADTQGIAPAVGMPLDGSDAHGGTNWTLRVTLPAPTVVEL